MRAASQVDSRIIKVDKDKGDLFVIECTDADCPYNNVIFHQTHDDYNQPTARDIRISDSLDKVTQAYGKPNRIMPAGGSDYYIFSGSNIIFTISNGKVLGWAIYYHV